MDNEGDLEEEEEVHVLFVVKLDIMLICVIKNIIKVITRPHLISCKTDITCLL